MPNSFEQILEQFPNASLSIRKDGPPNYRGENPHRIIIYGNPVAFRMLGEILKMMAETVEEKTITQGFGWHFVVGTEAMPQLQMDEGHLLSFNCDPDFGCTPDTNAAS